MCDQFDMSESSAERPEEYTYDEIDLQESNELPPTVETGDGDSHWYACPHCSKPIDVTGFCGERIKELEAQLPKVVRPVRGKDGLPYCTCPDGVYGNGYSLQDEKYCSRCGARFDWSE